MAGAVMAQDARDSCEWWHQCAGETGGRGFQSADLPRSRKPDRLVTLAAWTQSVG
jgi:hypothetical protein